MGFGICPQAGTCIYFLLCTYTLRHTQKKMGCFSPNHSNWTNGFLHEKPCRFPCCGEDICVNAFTCVYVWKRLTGRRDRGEQKGEKGGRNLAERQNIKREEYWVVWQLIFLTALWQATKQIAHGCRYPTHPSFTPQQRVLINYQFIQGRQRVPLSQISAL